MMIITSVYDDYFVTSDVSLLPLLSMFYRYMFKCFDFLCHCVHMPCWIKRFLTNLLSFLLSGEVSM